MKRVIILTTAGLLTAGLILVCLFLYYGNRMKSLDVTADQIREYDSHYLFISSDQSEMYQDLFSAASAYASREGAALEWCGSGTLGNYTAADCVDLAVAMDADGILLHPDNSAGLTEAIGRAAKAGIPVVTILVDLPDTQRVSYVGLSNYQMGDLYGERLIGLLKDGTNEVCLLGDENDNEAETQLFLTQMIQAVNSGAPSSKVMDLHTYTTDSQTDFDAEEVIRDILLSDKVPDILVCLNSEQTECSLQGLLDYNLVGKVQVIGYYLTDSVRSSLKQELLPVVMTFDPLQMGQDCIEALNEYRKMGRVSSYFNISLDSVTPATVDEGPYLEESSEMKEAE